MKVTEKINNAAVYLRKLVGSPPAPIIIEYKKKRKK